MMTAQESGYSSSWWASQERNSDHADSGPASTTNMATIQTSLSVATSESLFPLEMTKQFHFNRLVISQS